MDERDDHMEVFGPVLPDRWDSVVAKVVDTGLSISRNYCEVATRITSTLPQAEAIGVLIAGRTLLADVHIEESQA